MPRCSTYLRINLCKKGFEVWERHVGGDPIEPRGWDSEAARPRWKARLGKCNAGLGPLPGKSVTKVNVSNTDDFARRTKTYFDLLSAALPPTVSSITTQSSLPGFPRQSGLTPCGFIFPPWLLLRCRIWRCQRRWKLGAMQVWTPVSRQPRRRWRRRATRHTGNILQTELRRRGEPLGRCCLPAWWPIAYCLPTSSSIRCCSTSSLEWCNNSSSRWGISMGRLES